MRRLGAIGGIYLAANLNLEMLQRRAVAGLEKVIENLAPLWLRVVNEQAGRRARTDRAQAVKRASRVVRVEGDCGTERGDRGNADHPKKDQESQTS